MAKPGRSDEVSIDTSKASQPEVPTAVAPAAAPPVQAAAEVPAAVAEEAPPRCMIHAFEKLANEAHHAGDFASEGLLREIAVAAGSLRHKALAASGRLSGPAADFVDEIVSVL